MSPPTRRTPSCSAHLRRHPSSLPVAWSAPLPPSPAPTTSHGTFSFALNSAGATIATFKPKRPLRANVKYTVLISTDVATAHRRRPVPELHLDVHHRRPEPDQPAAAAARPKRGRPDTPGRYPDPHFN